MADAVVRIEREVTRVVVKVDVAWVGTFPFSFDAGTEWAARLLATSLQNTIGGIAEKARAQAYEQGWKDAKAKKAAKRTWFSRIWRIDNG